MITFVRRLTAVPGKPAEAVAFAVEIAQAASNIIGKEVKVLLPIGGNFSEIAWVAQYENLAELEEANAKVLQDEGYLRLAGKAAGLFVDGSGYDRIWRDLS